MKNLSSAPSFEFPRSNSIILVPVGLKDMGDFQFIPLSNLKIYIAVPAWIDYRRPSSRSDKIGIMGNSLLNNPFEQHRAIHSHRGNTRLLCIKVMNQKTDEK